MRTSTDKHKGSLNKYFLLALIDVIGFHVLDHGGVIKKKENQSGDTYWTISCDGKEYLSTNREEEVVPMIENWQHNFSKEQRERRMAELYDD